MRGRVLHVLAAGAAGTQAARERRGADGVADLLGHQHVDDGVDDRLDVRQAGNHHLKQAQHLLKD